MRPALLDPPILRDVLNGTPFPHFAFQKMGPGRVLHDAVVVKASFVLRPGVLPVADEPAAIELSDTFHPGREAAASSVERIGDLHLAKPGTDVIVTGTARPPAGRPTTRWTCEVLVHDGGTPILDHRVVATGPRRWERRALRGWCLSEPDATTGVPVRYELAYGGRYRDREADPGSPRHVVFRPNPSGTGFFDASALEPARTYVGPQWELPGHPVTAINHDSPLAGLGPVARMWASRLQYAGTYDRVWKEAARADGERGLVPDYPADFDARFFHCAHPALRTGAPLRGDEQYMLRGLVADTPELPFRLPAVQPRTEVLGRSGWRPTEALRLDTVHVDLDAARVHVTWRLILHPRDRTLAVSLFPTGGASPC